MVYAVGDIHGCLLKLKELTDELERVMQPQDTLLFLGDYIDRGPDSKGVIDHILDLKTRVPSVVTLRGNHEQMMLDAYDYFNPEEGYPRISNELGMLWFQNNAHTTLASFAQSGSWWERIPEAYWTFVENTEMEYTVGGYYFVHAGVLPRGIVWREKQLDPRLWIRDEFLHSSQDFGHVVVFGHTPLKEPVLLSNKIGIDTGAVFGGPLTAIALDIDRPYRPQTIRIFQAF